MNTITSAPAAAAPQQRSVLHIDGDGRAALLLATLLMPEARVTHAATLAAAARAIRHGSFHLVVLDPDLPDGDGAALLDVLQCAAAPPPVLLYAARDSIWRGAASAALLKPATSARQLWHTLAHLLDAGAAQTVSTPAPS
ncbi:response regulator [Janthinobacterium fluminis]|uniref:Response regulator n=1 Tax=Janthinobacterium fluminis TaxID=2987524 RepID=A0ABT5K430_9BURK|nr:response regulator [Janthinobacterium fluminis]MDC8759737.1 response regulator [Janthinobacterium fluminis]